MMQKRVLAFLVLFSFFFSINRSVAQQPMSGNILDSLTNEGLAGATISVLTKGDSVVISGTSKQQGTFNFANIPSGAYTLQVNFVGYKRQRQFVNFNSSQARNIVIKLPLDMMMLDAVEIDFDPPMTVLNGDTTEFNAGSFTTEPYADADALIGQLPGVEIDEEGKIKVQGEDVQRIMVDGKEFFSADPRIAMKTLPADIIAKIQVIDEKSDQAQFTGFDDGERKKIINIVTKPDRRSGYFGKVAGGYGNSERYNTGGSMNAFNGKRRLSFNMVSNNINQQNFSMDDLSVDDDPQQKGRDRNAGLKQTNNLAVNFNNEWWDALKLNANYTFNNTNNSVNGILNREYLIGKKSNQLSVQDFYNTGKNQSHRSNFRVEYEIDSNNSISFRPTIQYQKSDYFSNSWNTTSLDTQEPVNASTRDNDSERKNISVSGDFTYRRKLNSTGRTLSLSLNGSINSNKGLAHNLSLNEFYKDFILNRTDTVNNKNNTYADGNGLTGRLAYTERISLYSRLQANYSLRNTNSYSDRETLDFLAETGQFEELNTKLSNEFRNDYLYHSGGLGYLFSKDKIRLDAGINFQRAKLQNQRIFPIESEASRSFNSYLPKASFTYRFSKQKDIQFNYNTATDAPNINQLQDVINNQNSLNIRTGNADLKQEYGHRFSLRYKAANRLSGASFSVNMSANFSNDRIVNSTFLADRDTLISEGILLGKGGRFTRPENVDGYYSMRANTTLGIPLKKLKMNLSLNTGMFHTRDIGLLNNELTYSNSSGINQRVGINSRISQKIIFSFGYSGNYSVVKNNLNPNLSYNFYRQNLTNSFSFIFWKGLRASSSLNYYYNTGLTNDDSQSFFLWNASIGKKLFKRQEAEISLSAYDILNSNTSITRNISEQYIEDRESNMLNQYLILSFTYNLRKFGGKSTGIRDSRSSGDSRPTGSYGRGMSPSRRMN